MHSTHFITLSNLMLPEASYTPTRDRAHFQREQHNLENIRKALLLGCNATLEKIEREVGKDTWQDILDELKLKSRKDNLVDLIQAISRYNHQRKNIPRTPRPRPRAKPVMEEEVDRKTKVHFNEEPRVIRFDPLAPTNPLVRRKSMLEEFAELGRPHGWG